MWRILGILGLAPFLVLAQSAHDPVPDTGLGKRIFESQCTVCHGQGGTGGRGPALTRPTLLKTPDDESLRRAIAQGLPPEMPGSWQLSVREVASVAAYVKTLGAAKPERLPGDAQRGQSAYQSKGCGSCHIIAGTGAANGPELTSIGAKRNASYLRESIRKPAASLPDDYVLLEAVNADRSTIRGVRANEDPFTVQIRDTATGAFRSFRKSTLRDLRRLTTQSSMPAYNETSLPAEQLEDLVAYLATLRGGSR
ncbi:MAG: c-type cytochrome [Bryobacterales bacterium]|nr:c-type cytochrome [Bryobacterales bacterium]